MTDAPRAKLSVLVPTKNEERNLPDCLASVAWADEIIVFDSLSDDRTLEIAEAAGARIVQRKFDSFAIHKNWALDNIDFRHGWVLILDADERVTAPLAAEIRAAVERDDGPAGYYVARRTMFCGKWMRHGGVFPDFNMRLLRRGRGRYEDRLVHEHVILDGPAGYFENPLLHDDDKGLESYVDRHNLYSTLEAVEVLRAEKAKAAGSADRLGGNLFARGPQRRRALKSFAAKYLPLRPLWVFLYMYVVKLGFLDGRMGLRYATLRMGYEYLCDLKVIELRKPDSPLRAQWRDHLD